MPDQSPTPPPPAVGVPVEQITVTVRLTTFPDEWALIRTGLAVVDPAADFRAWVAERVATALDDTPLDHRANVGADVDGAAPWALVLAHRDTVAQFRRGQAATS